MDMDMDTQEYLSLKGKSARHACAQTSALSLALVMSIGLHIWRLSEFAAVRQEHPILSQFANDSINSFPSVANSPCSWPFRHPPCVRACDAHYIEQW